MSELELSAKEWIRAYGDAFTASNLGGDESRGDTWTRYAHGLLGRPGLDMRKRSLVLIGQFTSLRSPEHLDRAIRAAKVAGCTLEEIAEVIFHAWIYAGGIAMTEAMAVLERHLQSEPGIQLKSGMDSTSDEDLSIGKYARGAGDGGISRSPSQVEIRWATKYGSERVDEYFRLRPESRINTIEYLDSLDEELNVLWLEAVWKGTYARRVLDEGTRLLCAVGDCLAIGAESQYARHMGDALNAGVTPVELKEVLFQSILVVGHPAILGVAFDEMVALLGRRDLLSTLVATGEEEVKVLEINRERRHRRRAL